MRALRALPVLLALLLLLAPPDAPAQAPPAPQPAGTPPRTSVDLDGKRIAVLLGSTHDRFATKAFPRSTVLQYKTFADLILAVKTGKVDAGMMIYETVRDMMRTDPEIGMLAGNIYSDPVALGLRKGNADLLDSVDAFLREIRGNGVYDDMVRRWIVERRIEMPVIPNPSPTGVLKVGVASDKGIPWALVRDNRIVGFDIELVERFAAFSGRRLELYDMEFPGLLAAAASGRIDMIASTLAITEERRKQVDFSEPYYEIVGAVMVLAKNLPAQAPPPESARGVSSGAMRGIEDLPGRRIGVLLGSADDAFATKTYTRSTILQYETTPDLLLAVKSGKSDLGLLSNELLRSLQAQDPSLVVLAPDVYSDMVGMGFNKSRTDLRDAFDAFLREIRANGQYDDMVRRWVRERGETMPDVPAAVRPTQTLRVGVASNRGLPWVTTKDNRLIGLTIEMAERFAASSGRRLELLDMEFSSLLAAAASGRIDMIAATLSITDERRAQIDFSDPYWQLTASLFGLDRNVAVPGSPAPDAPAPRAADRPEPSFLAGLAERARANLLQEDRWKLILDGLRVTVLISILAALFGTLLGAVVCFMRMSRSRTMDATARAYVWLLRGTPVLVLLMIIYYVVFASIDIDPVLVAVVAFGMNFAAYVSEMFRAAIASVDRGQAEAGVAGGFTRAQSFRFIVMPQALRHLLPVYKGELISLVKMTSIVGYIAVQDLTKASDIIRSRTFDAFFPLLVSAVIYLLLAWLLTLAMDRVEVAVLPRRGSRAQRGAR